ncbi:tetratricopeptide repeat protein [Candidatus Uhrbacteria bacterium]|nr:tetratricopeptide repeat protein [Candidatus Uhrbacteria bacterium]MBD3284014.1 tetratricopeptide repeat protein [Candidatus Uhrbacteria bacterium]
MQEGTPIQNAPVVDSKHSKQLSGILGKVIDICVMGLALLMPLWFLPSTLDVLELNKQTLLVTLTMIALIAWVAKSLLDRSFSLTRSWLHLVVAFFLGGYLVTSLFSVDKYISFVGNVGQMQWAFTTVAAFVVLYFIVVNRYRTTGKVYDLLMWLLLGSAIAGLYGLFQMVGFHLFGANNALATKSFNTIGTINALAVFMAVPTVIAAALTTLGCTDDRCYLGHQNKMSLFWKIVLYATLAIGLLTAVIVDFWVVWAALLFGMFVIGAIRVLQLKKSCKIQHVVIPIVLVAVSVLFLFLKTPINLEIPAEVSPSASHTWQIAQQVLRDSPLFGSGPGTWLYDYAQYRSVGVNLSQFWTIRFERGLSAFLTMLAMIGLVGTTLWLILVVSGIVKSAAHLINKKDCDEWLAYLTVFTGWITTVFIAFLYNYNVAHHFLFWMLLALLGVLVVDGVYTWNQQSKKWVNGLLSAILILLAVGAISSTWLMGQRLVADAYYSKAVKSFQRGDSIEDSIKALETAVSMNKLNDVYYRNLSQAHLVKVSRMMQGEPNEELINQVNNVVAKAVEVARKATEVNPNNVDNFSNLAIVYQAIASFTAGADEFAIANYEKALELEPNNPVFMNEIGKLYVLRSDAYRTLLQSPDETARTEAEENVKAELAQAAEWFNKAITTKPDYAAAHFNLGLVYEREGRLEDSIRKFEEVFSVNQQDVGVAFQLAILYYRNGNKVKSRQLFEQIVQNQPKYANARWFLASIYEEEGMIQEAITQVEAVQALNPNNQDVVRRLEALRARLQQGDAAPEEVPIPEPLEQEIASPDQNPIQP